MAVSDVVDWVYTRLSAVSGIGQVYKYEPLAKDLKKAVDTFTSGRGNVLNVWIISHGSFTEPWETSHTTKANESLTITGFYSRSGDTTELTQRDLIESIREEFRTNIRPTDGGDVTLGSIVRRANLLEGGAQEMIEFMGILCHRVILTFTWVDQR